MGNPHCTFFVEDAEAIPLSSSARAMNITRFIPQRTNVQVASLIGPDHLRMRVWERGVGLTLASGSSSVRRRGGGGAARADGAEVRIDLDGGTLHVEWRDDGVWMTGATMHVFDGVLTAAFLAG